MIDHTQPPCKNGLWHNSRYNKLLFKMKNMLKYNIQTTPRNRPILVPQGKVFLV